MTDDLDGCDVDMSDPAHLTQSQRQIDALVLFADVDWTDADAVKARRAEWEALSDAS